MASINQKGKTNSQLQEELDILRKRVGELEQAASSETKPTKDAQQDNEIFAAMVADSPIGILVAQAGNIKFANTAFANLTGYSPSELLDRNFGEFIHPEDRPLVQDRHRQRLMGEKPDSRYSFRVLKKEIKKLSQTTMRQFPTV